MHALDDVLCRDAVPVQVLVAVLVLLLLVGVADVVKAACEAFAGAHVVVLVVAERVSAAAARVTRIPSILGLAVVVLVLIVLALVVLPLIVLPLIVLPFPALVVSVLVLVTPLIVLCA